MTDLARKFVLVAVLAAWPGAAAVDGAEPTIKLAVVTAAGEADAGLGAEVAAGVALGCAASNDAKAAGAKRPTVETLALTAAEGSGAAAIEKAAKQMCAGVVASVPETVAVEMEAAARKAKLPLVLVGPGGLTRTLDPADPVLRVEPCPADRALALAEQLRLRSGKSSIGLPSDTKKAWLVVEDAAWAKATAEALRGDDVDRVVEPGETLVKPGAEIGAFHATHAAAADACDRFVVIGGPAVLRAVYAALEKRLSRATVLCTDAALDGALTQAAPTRRRTVIAAATPTWADIRKPEDVAAKHPPSTGARGALTPAAVRGFVAASALVNGAVAPPKKGVLGTLREEHDGSGATECPLFDDAGTVDHWRSSTWTTAGGGAAEPIKAAYLPDVGGGFFLGPKTTGRFRVAPGEVCVRVGFGGGDGAPPRTIDADLGTIGLWGADSKANEMALEQILARTLSKLSRVWGRCYDSGARPSLSWKIAFVPFDADPKGASAVWEASIAGDGPDGLHGGQNFPKSLRAQALSTYLLRNAELLKKASLAPKLAAGDVAYLDGTYAWNATTEGNARCDKIRALLDGCASTFCMKLSKEIGHLAGLGVDHSGDPRCIMVAKGGEGTSDEFAYFPPAFAKVLERTLGRVGTEGK